MESPPEATGAKFRLGRIVLQRRVSGTPASFDHQKRHGMLSSNRFATD